MQPLVYLLRAPQQDDPFEAALRAGGYWTQSIPVLTFGFINDALLAEKLREPQHYGGLVLTSPRAVEAIERVLPELPDAMTPWADLPAWTVGPRTGELAQHIGLKPLGSGAGMASALVPLMVRMQPKGTLLFLSGDRRRDEVPRLLAQNLVPFEELTVYRTFPGAVDWEAYNEPEWIALFSPSGVDIVRAVPATGWSRVRFAAIGTTTADALTKAGLKVSAVASSPTPDALAHAIEHAG